MQNILTITTKNQWSCVKKNTKTTPNNKIQQQQKKQQTKSLCAYLHTWLVNRSIRQSASCHQWSTVWSVERDELMLALYPQVPLSWIVILTQREGWRGRTTGGPIRKDKPSPRSHYYHAAPVECPVSGFIANPVQLQSNQFNPSRGRSSPASLFQNIP